MKLRYLHRQLEEQIADRQSKRESKKNATKRKFDSLQAKFGDIEKLVRISSHHFDPYLIVYVYTGGRDRDNQERAGESQELREDPIKEHHETREDSRGTEGEIRAPSED